MPTPATRRRLLGAATLALAAAWAAPQAAWAQGSDTALKFILPNAAGSGVDTIIRAAQPALAKALGQPVVIDNQPGASGVIGLQALGRAAPDGHTLGFVSNNVVVLPHVLKSAPFKMPDDFTPIAVVGTTPLVLVANPKTVAARNAQEFIALLKAKPEGYTFASGGTGTILHLAAEMFVDEAGVKARHIPYKGVGQMVSDLLGGQVDFAVVGLMTAQQHLKTGALRAMGVSAAQRSAAAPDLPTFAEQGLPGYVVDGWFAVLGPKGLPAAQVQRVHEALVTAFNAPETREAMQKQGNAIQISSPAQAAAMFRDEGARFGAMAKKLRLGAP
ncbi:MAG: tripartite tricarboxylate transporter substrate binding protein [Pseudomonadota bacterium]|nr:tripartite tricarboxylate transporter substrate binding protein [Pseudomonadota bacterium]